MKTILLLHDEAREPTQLLGKALANNVPREIEIVAGSNCDRWGHPCPGCDEKAQPKTEASISLLINQTR